MEIKDYEDYTISEDGKVWSKYKNRFLKPCLDSIGYLYFGLSKNNKQKNFSIHRLLAIHFIPNPDNKPTVDHIDRNKTNNSLSNLRWATHLEQNENRGAIGEIKHKYISYRYNKKTGNKYYRIQKKGYFEKQLSINKYTLKDVLDTRRSFLILHKLPPLLNTE